MIPDEMLKRYTVENIESRVASGTPSEQAEEDTMRCFLTATDYIPCKLAEAQFLNEEIKEDYSDVLECRKYARTRIDEILNKKEALPFE